MVARQASRPTSPTLRRTLSLWQVALVGTGTVLGAGVYALIAPATERAGAAVWLAFATAGIAAGATAYVYARFSQMRPRNAPEFHYASIAFGPRVGFVAGWLMVTADLLAAAAVALGFGGYLRHLTGIPISVGALLLIGAAGLVLMVGIGESILGAILLGLVEAAGLVFVIIVGVPFWGAVDLTAAPRGIEGVVSAAALIFFAFLGFDEIGNLSDEMLEPRRDIPRALLFTMVASTVIYMLVAVSAVSVAGPEPLAAATAPLALVAGTVLGARADVVLSFVALAATANTVLMLLVSGSRSIHGVAAQGMLPSVLAHVSRGQLPARATILVVGVCALLAGIGDLSEVAELTTGCILVSFILVNASLFWATVSGLGPRRAGWQLSDGLVSLLAVGLCGWLLINTGPVAVGLALIVGALGGVIARIGPHRVGQSEPGTAQPRRAP
jgi:APA family basic amino acid/polyamine antiporter